MDMFSYLLGRSSGGGGKGGLKVEVVQELPETGQENTLYLVPRQVSKYRNVFDEYLWINETWEMVGTTDIDISGKQDTFQFSTLPTANASNVGKIVQYTGTTNANYTNGYFYVCLSDGGDPATYSWENISVQESPNGVSITYRATDAETLEKINKWLQMCDFPNKLLAPINAFSNSTIWKFNGTSTMDLTSNRMMVYFTRYSNGTGNDAGSLFDIALTITLNNGVATSLSWMNELSDAKIATRNKIEEITAEKRFTVLPKSSVVPTQDNQLTNKKYVDDNKSQVNTMPTASANNLGKVYQYVGTTTNDYTKGYFYTCVSDGGDPATYSWTNLQVQDGGGVVITSANKSSADVIAAVDAEYQKALNNEPYTVYAVYSPGSGSDQKVLLKFYIGSNGAILESYYFDRNYGTDHIGKLQIRLTLTDGHIIGINNFSYKGFGTGGASEGELLLAGGTQYITGLKQFNTLPKSSVVPTEDTHLVNKKYVDDLVGNINTVLATLTTPSNNGGN